ncbi:YcgN family cysteine cluster protein [Altericroceibacterium spongiae]|uniref:YcgN family cysteine cluster protein n=1 Tax=Altericroceibacterium spongiae TaxID=2320269 RepID=A0A420EJF0_9SPHN|nr:YcgN family cysteine cluster protein [Altericroceibacterium spongiae]RKF20783.1 YcgN family cysteine cluster protein [Altericroceibacterium spongiae]
MGSLRPKFWELPLDDLTRDEWEALCDGCGKCCLHKLEDEDTGAIAHTNVACKLLDPDTALCSDYRFRKLKVPDCMRLTLRIVRDVPWLPATCAYRLRADGDPLPDWHPLLTGNRQAMREAGISVAGRVVSELQAGPLENHIVDWPGEEPFELDEE